MADEQTPEAPTAEAALGEPGEAPAEPALSAAPPAPASGAPMAEAGLAERGRRKIREGTVISDKMQDTVVVAVVERVRHSKYGKTVQRTKKVYAHDASFAARPGDRVRVAETRPLSKLKRWRVTEVLERAR